MDSRDWLYIKLFAVLYVIGTLGLAGLTDMSGPWRGGIAVAIIGTLLIAAGIASKDVYDRYQSS